MEWFPSCQQLENNILLNTIDGVRGCWWGFLNERMASGARGTRSRRCSRARPVGTISWLRSQNIWISSMLYHYYINPASPSPPFSVQRFPLWPHHQSFWWTRATVFNESGHDEKLKGDQHQEEDGEWRANWDDDAALVNCCFLCGSPAIGPISPSSPGMEKCWSVLGWFLLVRTTTSREESSGGRHEWT